MIDIHSHILPGVDDGARTLDDSVEIVRELISQGVTDIITTPHYVNETKYVSLRSENLKRFKELSKRLKQENIDVKIYLGNEIYIDANILKLLKKKVITSLNGSKYLLVELPLNGEYQGYEDILLSFIEAGYEVILAHPERYEIFKKDYKLVQNLCEEGVLLQCNIGSFVKKYGRDAMKLARKMAKDKLIFAVGSDIHHCNRNDFILRAKKKLAKYYSAAELEDVLVNNPKKIIE